VGESGGHPEGVDSTGGEQADSSSDKRKRFGGQAAGEGAQTGKAGSDKQERKDKTFRNFVKDEGAQEPDIHPVGQLIAGDNAEAIQRAVNAQGHQE
jgi:hypothetical protein